MKKVLFGLICILIVLSFGFVEFFGITIGIDIYQNTPDEIEKIQENMDENYREIFKIYNDSVSPYDSKIYLNFDECNYEITKENVTVWKDIDKNELCITYGISEDRIYLKDINNKVLKNTIFRMLIIVCFAILEVLCIYSIYKKFFKKDKEE